MVRLRIYKHVDTTNLKISIRIRIMSSFFLLWNGISNHAVKFLKSQQRAILSILCTPCTTDMDTYTDTNMGRHSYETRKILRKKGEHRHGGDCNPFSKFVNYAYLHYNTKIFRFGPPSNELTTDGFFLYTHMRTCFILTLMAQHLYLLLGLVAHT